MARTPNQHTSLHQPLVSGLERQGSYLSRAKKKKQTSNGAGLLLLKCCFANGEFNEGTTELLPDGRGGTGEGTKVSNLEQRGGAHLSSWQKQCAENGGKQPAGGMLSTSGSAGREQCSLMGIQVTMEHQFHAPAHTPRSNQPPTNLFRIFNR